MSRSGYCDDIDDQWQFIRWRGAVSSAFKGARGVAFMTEMLAAMDALPERKLIKSALIQEGAVCAIGAVGLARGIDMTGLDPEDPNRVAATFGIAPAMAQEIVYTNDEHLWQKTPEERFTAMRDWLKAEIWNARGCVENPTGAMPHFPWGTFGCWGTHLHYKAVVALSEV